MRMIPRVYHSPAQVPFYWRDEQTGILTRAVMAYLQGVETDIERAWVLEYVRYVLDAPCWRAVETLRAEALQARTRADLDALLDHCLEVGIDPL